MNIYKMIFDDVFAFFGDAADFPAELCRRRCGVLTEVARSVPPYLLMAKRALDGADGLVGRVSTLRPGGLRFDTL